jgi:hypothetical protein
MSAAQRSGGHFDLAGCVDGDDTIALLTERIKNLLGI